MPDTLESLQEQLQQQRYISNVALTLNSIQDMKVLLSHLLKAALHISGCEEAFILLPDKKRDVLSVAAFQGENPSPLDRTYFSVIHTPAGKALRSGEIIVAEDARSLEITATYPTKALAYIPLTTTQQAVGVLAVWNRGQRKSFTETELALLKQLATHAAIAVDNVHLYEESQARGFELALIIDSTEAVNSSLFLSQVLPLIGKSLLNALQANWCEIITCKGEDLLTLAMLRDATWQPVDAPTVSLSKMPHLTTALMQRQWTPLSPDLATPSEKQVLNGAAYSVFVPVAGESGQICALLQIAYVDKPTTTLPEALIQEHGGNIALALIRQQYTRALHYARQVAKEVDAHWCSLWWWNQAENKLEQWLAQGSAVWVNAPQPTRALQSFPTFENILKDKNIFSYSVSDSYIPADIKSFLISAQVRALLMIPLLIREDENELGLVVMADTMRDRKFDMREQNLAHALVLQAANALKNAHLYQDLENSLEELRRTQAKLVQTARLSAIGELAAAVAHQINNPLTTVLGDTELMLSDIDERDRNWESLQAVYRAGQRAHEVVERLLNVARQKSPLDTPQLLDINQTIRNTLVLVEGTLYRSRVDLKMDLKPDLPPAYGIPGQLEDVWMNLLLNARDALEGYANPTVGIQSRFNSRRNRVEVIVWDNGPGIPPESGEKLFDAFYTTKPVDKGTGLGLYICQTIVEKCGGTITIDSRYNKGARFIVSLPG